MCADKEREERGRGHNKSLLAAGFKIGKFLFPYFFRAVLNTDDASLRVISSLFFSKIL